MEQVKWEVGAELPDWLPNPKPVVLDDYDIALKALIEDLGHDRDDIGAGTEEYNQYSAAIREVAEHLCNRKSDEISAPEKEFRFNICDTFIYWLSLVA